MKNMIKFMTKTSSKLEIEDNFLNLIQNIYKKPTPNIIFHDKRPTAFLLRPEIRQRYPFLINPF